MDFEEVIYKRRTIRRFKQIPVPIDLLRKIVDFARVAPAGQNIQSIEYIIITNQEFREKLFQCLSWAGALPPEMRTPEEGRKPMSYIIVLTNNDIKKGAEFDVGAAVENILLGCVNFGLGACWMGAIDRGNIQSIFKIPKNYEVKHVISIGYPDEESVIEPYKDTFKYWKDESGKMHIPKRDLDKIIFKIIE